MDALLHADAEGGRVLTAAEEGRLPLVKFAEAGRPLLADSGPLLAAEVGRLGLDLADGGMLTFLGDWFGDAAHEGWARRIAVDGIDGCV